MSDIHTGTSTDVRAFLVRLWRYSPRRVVTVWLLGGAVAMTEGIGLMMLVPLLGLLGIGTNATDGGMTLSLPFADTLLPAYETPSIGLALILFVGLVGLRQALKYKSDMQGAQLRLDFVDSLRNTLFRRMAGSEWSYISQVRHGDLMQAFSGEVASVGLGVQQLQALFVGAALTAVYLVGALLLAPSTLLPALIGIGFVAALLFRWTHRYSVERGHELVETLKQQKHGIEQFLGSLKWAKAHGLEGRHIDRFEDQTRAARTSMLAHHANRSAEQALFHLGAAITLAFVAWLAVRSDWPTGQWIAFVVVIARLVPLLSRLLQNVHQVLHMLPTFTQLVGLENGCLHHAEPPSQGDIPPIALEEAIDIRGLEFAYTQGTPSVRIEALQLPACGTYALVGASGAGKTTVADLLAGL
ncbi:MAG: ABC transporter transmembrane domain-containing protein, partial [Gammaproteobacteria bacterium]